MTETVSVGHEPPPETEPILDLIDRLAAPGGAVSATLHSMATDMRPDGILRRQHNAMSEIEAGLARFYGEAIRSNRIFTPVSSIPRPLTYPWPTTAAAIGAVEDTINAVLADPAAQAKVQELAGQIDQATAEEEPPLCEEDLIRRIEELEQTVEELQASANASVTEDDSRWRAKFAVFCILQGILLVLAPVLAANLFTWFCNLVAMALQFDKRPGKTG